MFGSILDSVIRFILSNSKKLILILLLFSAFQAVSIFLRPYYLQYVFPYLIDAFIFLRYCLALWEHLCPTWFTYFFTGYLFTEFIVHRTAMILPSIVAFFRHQDD